VLVLDVLALFGVGVLLGLSIAAPPGPANAMIATHAVTRKRWWAGTLVGFGAMTADAMFLAITYLVGRAVQPDENTLVAIYGTGACVMFFFAYNASREWRKPPMDQLQEVRPTHSYFSGLAIGLTNPYQILWWLTAGLAFIQSVGLAIVAGFFCGIIVWTVSFPWALDFAKRRIEKAYHGVLFFSLATLIILGTWLILQVAVLLRT
jgi:threonine/homoserine/homoserine lactone efflux protein